MIDAWPPKRGIFSDYFSATLLMGCLAGAVSAFPDGPSVLSGPLLLMVPGIVRRSLPLALLGPLLGIAAVSLVPGTIAWSFRVDNRETVPIIVHHVPVLVIMNPGGWSGGITGWPGRCYAVLFSYLLSVDIAMLLLRGIRSRTWRDLLRAVTAILASNLVAAVLFPLSWFAWTDPLKGRLCSFGAEAVAVAVFALLWPIKYSLLNYLYAPALFTRPYGEDADIM